MGEVPEDPKDQEISMVHHLVSQDPQGAPADPEWTAHLRHLDPGVGVASMNEAPHPLVTGDPHQGCLVPEGTGMGPEVHQGEAARVGSPDLVGPLARGVPLRVASTHVWAGHRDLVDPGDLSLVVPQGDSIGPHHLGPWATTAGSGLHTKMG